MRVTSETKNATRKRILEVAERHFAQQGFETTTTRDIAGAAHLGVGTLFNYFPTKESIVECLVSAACARAEEAFAAADHRCAAVPGRAAAPAAETPSLDEELFAHVAAILRKVKPHRKYLLAVLETSLSPLADEPNSDQPSLRAVHLETVSQIVSRHGHHEALSSVALQLYWTLYVGALAFWSQDSSPRQEDTLALLDQSLAMFVGWLSQASQSAMNPQRNGG